MFTRKKATAVWNERVKRLPPREKWNTAFLLLSSAALGGIAVALWNRRTLEQMRTAAATEADVTSEQMEFFEYE